LLVFFVVPYIVFPERRSTVLLLATSIISGVPRVWVAPGLTPTNVTNGVPSSRSLCLSSLRSNFSCPPLHSRCLCLSLSSNFSCLPLHSRCFSRCPPL
jgi:hypothetical protein